MPASHKDWSERQRRKAEEEHVREVQQATADYLRFQGPSTPVRKSRGKKTKPVTEKYGTAIRFNHNSSSANTNATWGNGSPFLVVGTGSTSTWPSFTFEEVPEEPKVKPVADDEFPGYTLEGYFQGVKHVVADIGITDSPIEAVIKAVFGLKEDDEISAVAIRRDGVVEVISWDQIQRKSA